MHKDWRIAFLRTPAGDGNYDQRHNAPRRPPEGAVISGTPLHEWHDDALAGMHSAFEVYEEHKVNRVEAGKEHEI